MGGFEDLGILHALGPGLLSPLVPSFDELNIISARVYRHQARAVQARKQGIDLLLTPEEQMRLGCLEGPQAGVGASVGKHGVTRCHPAPPASR